MRLVAILYSSFSILSLEACKEEKKPAAQQGAQPAYNYPYYDQNYEQNYNSTASLYATGTLRIEVSPMTNGTTLQGIVNQDATWTFRAISATTGGNAVIFKVEPDGEKPSSMRITETDTDTATITWKPASRENKSGSIRITARDVSACNGTTNAAVPTPTAIGTPAINATCTDYATSTSTDLVTTYTYQVGSSSADSSQNNGSGALVAGILLGSLTGLLASNGDPTVAMTTGLQSTMLMTAGTQGQMGQFGVPYGYIQSPYGYNQQMVSSQYPYMQNGIPSTYIPGGFNINTVGQQSCISIYNQAQCTSRAPACQWSFDRCVDARNSQFGNACTNYNSMELCRRQNNCTWIGNNISGYCQNY